jgi:hypothetical protein
VEVLLGPHRGPRGRLDLESVSTARGRARRRNRLGAACLLGFAELINAQGFRERVDVELVRVEMLATDGQGQPVKGLRPDEVQVRVADFSGKPEKTSARGSTWPLRSGQIRVKRGAYRCSFAIRDERTEITSYLTFDRKLP